ncbi:hypothetical protein KAK07_01015 [Ideonella sp. 4Y16]|uniref:Uncharacterized protein n=1 Tax=Ideonella alba TaxID=2824118 RepID=A0A940Y8K1_9BURK|nr:hypothetical protein [Ideonella alba]MBQ0929663.1 hypothetical protein [Ideonella alba]MBQ0941905.1 hypothetical protein [Ideonella alba]
MRAAPTIEIQADLRGGWWIAAWLLWGLAALAWAGTLAWHIDAEGLPGLDGPLSTWLLVGLGGLGVLTAAVTALWHARHHPAQLRWTGTEWRCTLPGQWQVRASDEGEPGQVDTVIDVGDAMLLRWESEPADGRRRRRVWLPVARSSQGSAWHPLRVALRQTAAPAEGPLA